MAQNIESSEFWKTKYNTFNNNFLNNICRLCANICDNPVPIFDKTTHKGNIHSKLKKCFPSILVLENDPKPKQICSLCVSKLDSCISFIEMSLDSDTKFEIALQNRPVQQIQIMNDFTWPQMKQDSIWNFTKASTVTVAKPDQKWPQVTIAQLPNATFQQKPYQQMVQVPVSTSNSYPLQDGLNLGLILGKQDVNHNILPGAAGINGLSQQDLIFLVELKKDNSSNSPVKKTDASSQSVANKVVGLSNYQPKAPTGQVVRTSNSSSFDDKFNHNQSAKVTSSFINDSASTASILKALESEVLNGVIKLENLNGESVTLHEPLKPDLDTSFESIPSASTSSVDSIKQPPTRDFECTICNKVFSRRNRLNAHLARHSSIRPHSCDKCDQRFITRWDLTLHLRIHSGIFSCEFCGKAFPAKGKLERHRRTHTGERPFPCDLCNKAFSEKRNLENHLKTHAVVEVHQNAHVLCQTCGRGIINVDGSTLKSKCDSCEKKTLFEAFVDSSRPLGGQCGVAKCQSNQQSSHTSSSAVANMVSNFLK